MVNLTFTESASENISKSLQVEYQGQEHKTHINVHNKRANIEIHIPLKTTIMRIKIFKGKNQHIQLREV